MRKPVFIVFALIMLARVLCAEEVKVSATLDEKDNQIYAGDSATLTITISGTTDSSIRPKIPEVFGMTIQYGGGPMVGTTIINGVVSRQLSYVYRIMARKKGEYEIPSFEVTVDDTQYKSKPLKINVIDISKSDKLLLETDISTSSTYIQEPVTVTYEVFLAPGVKLRSLDFPLVSDSENMGLYKLVTVPQDDIMRIGRARYDYGYEQKSRDGVSYIVYSFKFRFYPTKPGNFTIDSPLAIGRVPAGTKVEGDRFFGTTRRVPNYTEVRATSDPLTLTVKDVPEKGKPVGYTGAVGRYAISVSTDQKKVKVGDPIELTIKVSGQGLLEKVPRPDLAASKDFAEGFKISESLQPGELIGNAVVFNQIVRPRSVDVTEIPSISFPYFDIEEGKYEIAESAAIPLKVLETTVVTAEGVIKTPGLNGATLEEKAGGINAIYFHPEALVDQRVNLTYLWFLAIPVAGYIAAATVVTRNKRLSDDRAFARSKFARKALQERLSEARRLLPDGGSAFYNALWKGVAGYISDKLDLAEGELTANDLEQLSKGPTISRKVLDEMSELLAICDEGRFAVDTRNDKEREILLKKSEELISRIQRNLK